MEIHSKGLESKTLKNIKFVGELENSYETWLVYVTIFVLKKGRTLEQLICNLITDKNHNDNYKLNLFPILSLN